MPPSKKITPKQIKHKVKSVPKKEIIAPTPEPVETSPKEEQTEILDYSKEFENLSESLKNALSLVKDLTSQVNKLHKQIAKDKKSVDKEIKKKNKTKKTDRVLNGFSKPGPVSAELKKFFDLDKDEKIARTEVTKKITAAISLLIPFLNAPSTNLCFCFSNSDLFFLLIARLRISASPGVNPDNACAICITCS